MPPKQQPSKKREASQHSPSSTKFFLASLVVLVAVLFFYKSQDSTTQTINGNWGFNITKNVTRWKWDPRRPFMDEVFALNEPVILENSFVELWKARNWTPEYLSQYIPKLSSVKQHKNPIVTYYEDDTMLEHAPIQWRKSHHEIVMMDTKDFFNKAANDKTAYYYFSEEFRGVDANFYTRNHRSLMEELEPSSFLSLNGLPPEYIGLWMGGRGVTASLHYDVSDNVFVQLYGHKKFIFWPPEAYKDLHVFPRLSPNHRQSQIDFSSSDYLTKYPQLKSLPAYEALLGPGDVLVFPAFWFHHVTSLDLCISINAWSQSNDWRIIENKLFKVYLPELSYRTKFKEILREAGFQERAVQTKIVFKLLIEQLVNYLYAEDGIKVDSFMSQLYASRYAPLVNENDPWIQNQTALCPPAIDEATTQALVTELEPYKEELVSIFNEISRRAVRDMHVENYVEDLVALIASESNLKVEQAVPFMKHCFK